MQDYVNQGFGALICWNMPTFVGTEQANPNLNPNTFAPTSGTINIDQWLDSCVDAGMTYACLTTKHHDGFALWPTNYTISGSAYSIAQTSWYAANGNPDIVGQFVAKCNQKGLHPCLYFSIWDTTYETRTGTDENSDAARYLAMIKAQLTELLTNYGHITAIWLDGYKWHLGYEEVFYPSVYHHIRSIDPNTLIIENNHLHPAAPYSEIEVYETPFAGDGSIPSGNTALAEEVDTIRSDGFWFATSNNYKTASAILALKAQVNSRNGTFMLGIQPGTDGRLNSQQVTLLGQL